MTQPEQRTSLISAVDKQKDLLFPAVANFYRDAIALVRGEGEYAWDEQGNKYLERFGSVLTVSFGQENPRTSDSWIEQADAIANVSTICANL